MLEAFRNDPILAERAMDIGSIGEGVIELAGWVEDEEESHHAVTIARGVPGVDTVVNRIAIGDEERALRGCGAPRSRRRRRADRSALGGRRGGNGPPTSGHVGRIRPSRRRRRVSWRTGGSAPTTRCSTPRMTSKAWPTGAHARSAASAAIGRAAARSRRPASPRGTMLLNRSRRTVKSHEVT